MGRHSLVIRILVVLALVCALSSRLEAPERVEASTGLFASELTQLANNIQLVNIQITHVMQYSVELQQLLNDVKKMEAIPNQVFGDIEGNLAGLGQVVQGGQALAYNMANLDNSFTSKFGGFGYRPVSSSGTPMNFANSYATWAQTGLDSIQHALSAAGLQSSQLSTTTGLISQFRNMAQGSSSAGEMQALQIGNQIAAEEVNELVELRQLMMADMQSKAAYQSAQIQMAADTTSSANSFFLMKDTGPGSDTWAGTGTMLDDSILVGSSQ
jgi:P-type conjugative transfer protein TrbJ